MIRLDEAEIWAVQVSFGGELAGPGRNVYLSITAAEARQAELQLRFPLHKVEVLRGTVSWAEMRTR